MSADATRASGRRASARPPDPGAVERRRARDEGIARAIEAARSLHVRFRVEKPADLHVEHTAAALRGYVVYEDTGAITAGDANAGAADACVARAQGVAIITLPRWAEGTPRGRFSAAHEIAHLVLHPDADALARIHGLPRAERREFDVEHEADAFASEWLLPHALFADMCGAAEPMLDDVARVGRVFGTSLTTTAKRWTQLAPAGVACAFVESKGGRVRHFDPSPAFRARVVRRRVLEDSTWAAEIARDVESARAASVRRGPVVGRETPLERRPVSGAWGSAAAGVELFEQSVPVHGTDVVLTWLWHPPR